jgi:hypothetical protein
MTSSETAIPRMKNKGFKNQRLTLNYYFNNNWARFTVFGTSKTDKGE